MFKKFIGLIFISFSVGGCAVPVSVQIASWAIDGLSLLATQKSVTDHGISIIAQKDCAVWRGVVEGEMCRGPLNNYYALGDKLFTNDGKYIPTIDYKESNWTNIVTPMSNAFVPDFDKIGSSWKLNNQLVYKAYDSWEENQEMLSLEQETAMVFAMRVDREITTPKNSLSYSYKVSQWFAPVKPAYQKKSVNNFGYFVLGSFQNISNARRLTAVYKSFKPFVVALYLKGKKNFRVVVGPIPKLHQTVMLSKFERLGLKDTWLVKGSSEWRLPMANYGQKVVSGSKTELSSIVL